MKKLIILLSLSITFNFVYSQGVPQTTIKDINGTNVSSTSIIENDGNPVILSFWATWCKPCIQELTAFNDELIDWEDEFGVKIVAVSTDNPRSTNRVAPFVSGQGWEFDVYLDASNDFRRAMNVGNVPHTFIIDGNGNVVWQHTSYLPGDEQKVYKALVDLKNKK